MDRSPRLYYLDDIPTPYRLDVHRRIARLWPGSFHLAFCAASEPGRAWSFDFDGLDVEILKGWQYRPRRQINPISIKLNLSVWNSLNKLRPDVVVLSGYLHPTTYIAAAWCRLRGVPYGIVSETSARSRSASGASLRGIAKRVLARWLVRHMSFGLPVGAQAAEYLNALGAGSAPMSYFPNTPDTRRIANLACEMRNSCMTEELRAKFGIGKNVEMILFVGRLIEAKCPMDALNAYKVISARHPESALVFVGDGPLLSQLRLAAGQGDRIFFTGWISDTSIVMGLMASAAIFVLPSEHEPWGAVVNEAMAASAVVIASDQVGAAHELIKHGHNGYIYPVHDVPALAEILSSCLHNRSALSETADAARETSLARGCEYAADNLIKLAISQLGDKQPKVGWT